MNVILHALSRQISEADKEDDQRKRHALKNNEFSRKNGCSIEKPKNMSESEELWQRRRRASVGEKRVSLSNNPPTIYTIQDFQPAKGIDLRSGSASSWDSEVTSFS
ncbi:unnamed protein product [Protopolystoma xenopodis]|uniref:Uncharacterized protein n=1 Tax=Protopolystoma xenopodis TaxID=117903 RepID=A0A3S5CQM7_9PLAT|nr:unnamed protein product [Protopolystoma xenopodis]